MTKFTKNYWGLIRTLLFWVVGFRNTVFVQPDEVGTWKHIIGFIFLAVAIIDTYFYLRKAWKEDPRH